MRLDAAHLPEFGGLGGGREVVFTPTLHLNVYGAPLPIKLIGDNPGSLPN